MKKQSSTLCRYITRIERPGKLKSRCVYYIVRPQRDGYQQYLGSFSSLVKAKKALKAYEQETRKEQQ
jgi:hypothetical protein